MIIPRVKKAAIAAAVLLLITLLVNTAFGKGEDLFNSRAAHTSNIDVKIMERTKSCSCCAKHTSQIIDAAESVQENLDDIAPGDTVVLSYKIINSGCIDVLMDGVFITVDNSELNDYINLKWTVNQYHDDKPINTISSTTAGQSLSNISLSNSTSHNNIILEHDSSVGDYCLLELEINYNVNSPQLNEVSATAFTITPSFIQN